jgi:hypothetical protein
MEQLWRAHSSTHKATISDNIKEDGECPDALNCRRLLFRSVRFALKWARPRDNPSRIATPAWRSQD